MIVVPLSSIEIRKRQRSKIDRPALNELKESILGRGLLHPPVCWQEADKWVLLAGERRLTAIQEIAKEGKNFIHGDLLINPGDCPITQLGDYLDAEGRFEAELDENIRRQDLDWQDEARALADLHAMRQQSNSKQSILATAKEVATKAHISPREASRRIRDAATVAAHLSNPKIANARNLTEAAGLVLKAQDEIVKAALARRRLAAAPEKPEVEIRHGDCVQILSSLDAGSFDLTVADPPYGISASGDGFRSRTVHHHNYKDTEEAARDIAKCILTESFRLSKTGANLFMFCDIDLFQWLKEVAANMGWVPFRTPLVWQKSESEGMAPWGQQGPRRTTEYIFYATKGQKGLLASPVDVLTVKRVSRHERIHAAEKPVELIRRLIECSTLPGDTILDPCCGSGSTLVAAKELKRRALGIEKDFDYYNTAMANVYGDKRDG